MPKSEATQQTKPKVGEGVEIPVPTKKAVLDALTKISKPSKSRTRRPKKKR